MNPFRRINSLAFAIALIVTGATANAGGVDVLRDSKKLDAQPFINTLRVAANVADAETVTIDGTVFEFDTAATSTITAGNTRVNINAAQTPTASIDALITAAGTVALSGITFEKISANELLVKSTRAIAVAETLAGTNNAWAAATSYGGTAEPRLLRSVQVAGRVPNAQEVAIGNAHFVFGFSPAAAIVSVRVTATGVSKAWDGAVTISGNRVTLDNAGATDWAATDTVTVVASN